MLSLKEKQERIHDVFDFDEVREIRLALSGRLDQLEKLEKKESELGIDAHQTRESKRMIEGTETRPGLLRVISHEKPENVQQDAFYDKDPATCAHENVEADGDESVCTGCGQIIHQIGAESEEPGEIEEAEFEVVGEADWKPTPELVERARALLGKQEPGAGWGDIAEGVEDDELRQTILFVEKWGWGCPTREPETANA